MSVYGQINNTSYATAPPQVGGYPSLPQFSSTTSIQPSPSYYTPPSPAPSRSTIYSSVPSSPYVTSGLYASSTLYPGPPPIPVSVNTSMTPPPMATSPAYLQGSGYRTTYPSPAPTLPPMTITLSSPFIKAEPVHPDVLYGSYISMDEMKAHVMRQFNLTLIPDYPDLNFGKTDEVHSKSAMEVYSCLFINTHSTSAIEVYPCLFTNTHSTSAIEVYPCLFTNTPKDLIPFSSSSPPPPPASPFPSSSRTADWSHRC